MKNSDISERLRINIASTVIRIHTAYRLRLLQVFMRAGIDITPDMYFVLKHLWAKDNGSRQQNLADKTGKDKASLTKLLENLEKRGLVNRKTDERDKRSKRVWLTTTGRKLKEKVYPLALSVVELTEQGVEQADLQQAQSILETVYNNIKR